MKNTSNGFTPTPMMISFKRIFKSSFSGLGSNRYMNIFKSPVKKQYHHWCRGFTLIELLVVIAIIGVLSSVVLASVNSARDKAREAKARAQLKSISNAMEMMLVDTGEWPGHQNPYEINNGSSNEIDDITSPSFGLAGTDGSYANWNGPYIKSNLVDPWGNPYFFDTDYDINRGVGSVDYAAVIGSFGPNGVGMNVYDSDDIIYVFVN